MIRDIIAAILAICIILGTAGMTMMSSCQIDEVGAQELQELNRRSIIVDERFFSSLRTISTGDSLKSRWIYLGNGSMFNIFMDIDSLDTGDELEVRYQLSPWYHTITDSTTEGWIKAGEVQGVLLYTFVLGDTINNGKRYISLHSSGTSISVCRSVQFVFSNTGTGSVSIGSSSKIIGQP